MNHSDSELVDLLTSTPYSKPDECTNEHRHHIPFIRLGAGDTRRAQRPVFGYQFAPPYQLAW